jgi:hypothetical protein
VNNLGTRISALAARLYILVRASPSLALQACVFRLPASRIAQASQFANGSQDGDNQSQSLRNAARKRPRVHACDA